MWQGGQHWGLQLAPQQPCPAWGGPPPTLQLASQRERMEIAAQGCSGMKNTVCRPSLHFLYFEARGWAWGCWCIEARKPPRQETQVDTDTWASGHAADQNWTLSQSQKVKFEMEGMGCVLTGPETRPS